MEERVEMLRMATAHIPNARVTCFSGLLNEFCRQEKAPFIVRGLRAFSDFEYEFQRALLIKKIDNGETVRIPRGEDVTIARRFALVLAQGEAQDARTGALIERETARFAAESGALGL